MESWKLHRVEFYNLMRYKGSKEKPNVLSFNKIDKTYLVLGQNEDDPGVDSNGAGKSSLFDIISFGIFGKTARTEKFVNILNRGSEEGYIKLTLTNGDYDVNITRHKSLDKKINLLKFDNGFDDLSLRTYTLTQKAINKFFGFDEVKGFDDYLSQVYFSTVSSKGFLSTDTDPAERQAVLERFLGLSLLDKARDLVKVDEKSNQLSLVGYESKIEQLTEIIEGVDIDYISDELEQLDKVISSERLILEDTGEFLKRHEPALEKFKLQRSIVNKASLELVRIESKIESIRTRFKIIKSEDALAIKMKKDWEDTKQDRYEVVLKESQEQMTIVNGLNTELRELQLDEANLGRTIDKFNREIALIDKALSNSIKCPACSIALSIRNNEVTEVDEKSLRVTKADKMEELEIEFQTLKNLQDKDITKKKKLIIVETGKLLPLQKEVKELSYLKRKVDAFDSIAYDNIMIEAKKVRLEKFTEENNILIANKELEELQSIYSIIYDELLEQVDAKQTLVENTTNTLNQHQIEKTALRTKLETALKHKIDLGRIEHDCKGLRGEATRLNYWIKTFPTIKRDILFTFIPVFEEKINEYLASLEVRERVQLELLSKTKTDSLKKGFLIKVFDGESWAEFRTYSGGEKSRIMLSVGFALRDLAIEKIGGGFGFLLCDELLDNLDKTGIDLFFDMVQNVSGQKFVITHAKPEEVALKCDKKIIISRRDEVSTCQIT